MSKIEDLIKDKNANTRDIFVMFFKEIARYRQALAFVVLVALVLAIIAIVVVSSKPIKISIPGVSTQTVEINQITAPERVIEFISEMYVDYTQTYNYDNYLIRHAKLIQYIMPGSALETYENQFRKDYDETVKPLKVGSRFDMKGNPVFDPETWNVTVNGIRQSSMSGKPTLTYEVKIIIHFKNSDHDVLIDNVSKDEKQIKEIGG